MMDIRILSRLSVVSLALLALVSCSGARLSLSRAYVPTYEVQPRSTNQTREEYEASVAANANWASVGHIIYLKNEGSKKIELTEVVVGFQDMEAELPLIDAVTIREGGVVSLPLSIPKKYKVACLIPAFLKFKRQLEGQSEPERDDLSFTDRMDEVHFREWRLAGCGQSEF